MNYTGIMKDQAAHRPPEPDFIQQVHSRLEAALWQAPAGALPSSSLEQAARTLLLASDAKRARARLVLQVGQLLQGGKGRPVVEPAALVDIAAAIELIHGASLLHDDVVDGSDRRRGVPTANASRGNSFAVLCGDLVLARAVMALVPFGATVVGDAVAVVEEMTRAALVEVEDRGSFDVPLTRWRAMAEGKTGALFGLCARLPCRLAADDDRGARLARGFRHIGVAFQIVDDLNDLTGRDPTKPRGQDLREKNPSLPLLLARMHDRDLARSIDEAAANDVNDAKNIDVCQRVLRTAGAASVDVARQAIDEARRTIGDDAAGLRGLLEWTVALVDGSIA